MSLCDAQGKVGICYNPSLPRAEGLLCLRPGSQLQAATDVELVKRSMPEDTFAAIKGTTVKEIQHEIKETENELKEVGCNKMQTDCSQTKSELTTLESTLFGLKDTSYKDRTKKMHVVHNIKLVKHEIDILETKLNRLQKRLKAALLFSNNAAPKAPEKSHEEDEQADDNDEGENDTRTDYGDDIDEPPESDDDE